MYTEKELFRVLDNFRMFLINSHPNYWSSLHFLNWDENPYWFDEWLQCNWKLMVGEFLCGSNYLLRDYRSPINSIILDNNGSTGQTEIICINRNSDVEFGVFSCFGSMTSDGFRYDTLPFDIICAVDKQTATLVYEKFENTKFLLTEQTAAK